MLRSLVAIGVKVEGGVGLMHRHRNSMGIVAIPSYELWEDSVARFTCEKVRGDFREAHIRIAAHSCRELDQLALRP